MRRLWYFFALAGTLFIRSSVEAAPSAFEERIAWEDKLKSDGMFLLPHRPNYLMPFSYNANPNDAPSGGAPENLQNTEIKFQFSGKVPIAEHIFKWDVATYIAYTQMSFWQAYNSHTSSAFRDSDYEPELFLQANTSHPLGPLTNRYNRLGYSHQSNGQSDPFSRSWNRLYAEFFFDISQFMFSVKPWYRLTGPADKDTNPDIWKYMGYGELRAAMKVWKQNECSLMFRNNLRSPDNKGAIELGWSFPLIRSMHGYVQYFNGYGESLLDYNHASNRISVGVSFSNWL